MITVNEAIRRVEQAKQAPREERHKAESSLMRDVLLSIAAGHRFPRTLASAALNTEE